jgi:prophage regulatory protein
MQHTAVTPEKLIRLPSVLERVGVSRSTLWSWVREKRFPPPVRLGLRAVGWRESEVDAWIAERVAESRTPR